MWVEYFVGKSVWDKIVLWGCGKVIYSCIYTNSSDYGKKSGVVCKCYKNLSQAISTIKLSDWTNEHLIYIIRNSFLKKRLHSLINKQYEESGHVVAWEDGWPVSFLRVNVKRIDRAKSKIVTGNWKGRGIIFFGFLALCQLLYTIMSILLKAKAWHKRHGTSVPRSFVLRRFYRWILFKR